MCQSQRIRYDNPLAFSTLIQVCRGIETIYLFPIGVFTFFALYHSSHPVIVKDMDQPRIRCRNDEFYRYRYWILRYKRIDAFVIAFQEYGVFHCQSPWPLADRF